MNKEVLTNEVKYQLTVKMAEMMLGKKLITGKEYQGFEREMYQKYKPVFGSLYR